MELSAALGDCLGFLRLRDRKVSREAASGALAVQADSSGITSLLVDQGLNFLDIMIDHFSITSGLYIKPE